MTYQPNLTDPRILKRAQSVLAFLQTWMISDQPRRLSQSVLYKAFGNTNRGTGQWFLDQTLETTDTHWNYQTGKCKQYRVRPEARAWLTDLLGKEIADRVTVSHKITQQIESGVFDYQHKNNRDFTPAQFLPRDIRESTLSNHGYLYHYDIRTAAPTLLLQRARQLDPDFVAPHIDQFIQHRQAWRSGLALRTGITDNQAKRTITALFLGARILPHWHQNTILQLLDYDHIKCQRLRADPDLCALRSDISRMWAVLSQEITRRTITLKNQTQRRLPVSAREKSKRYFELENQVGSVIKRSLRKRSVRFLWLHDGWSSDQVVDLQEIHQRVRVRLGFDLVIDWHKYHDEEISKEI